MVTGKHGLVLAVAAGALGGCDCAPLAEIEVRGDPGTAREQVQRALGDFATWVSEPVCLSSARVGSVKGDRAKYNPINRSVEVDALNPEPRESALHELCHALDIQNDLVDGDIERFAALAEDRRGSEKRRAREGFADVCMVGAPNIRLATAVSCPKADVPEPWARVQQLAYPVDLPMPVLGLRDVASWTIPDALPGAELELASCGEDGTGELVVLVREGEGTGYWYQLLDLHSGEPVDRVPAGPVDVQETSAAPAGWTTAEGVATDQGAVVWAWLVEDAGEVRRLLAERDGQWGVVDACPRDGGCLFVMEGQAFVGRLDWATVTWAVVE